MEIMLLMLVLPAMAIACQTTAALDRRREADGQPRLPELPIATADSPQPDGQGDGVLCFSAVEAVPVAFTPEGTELLVRTRSGVELIDLDHAARVLRADSAQDIAAVALAPDGEILAWSLPDGRIQLIRLSDLAILADLSGHPDPALDLRFSASSDRLYSASHDGVVRVWSLDGQLLKTLHIGAEVVGFGIDPDEQQLATIPSDGPVRLWDLATGRQTAELGGTGGYDTSDVVFSPDGRYLAADLATGVYLWRVADGSLVWNEVTNSMAVAFAPDGQYLAYAELDQGNRIALAAPDASRVIRLLDPFNGPVFEMFFSPDGTLLAATDGIEIRVSRAVDGTLAYAGTSQCP